MHLRSLPRAKPATSEATSAQVAWWRLGRIRPTTRLPWLGRNPAQVVSTNCAVSVFCRFCPFQALECCSGCRTVDCLSQHVLGGRLRSSSVWRYCEHMLRVGPWRRPQRGTGIPQLGAGSACSRRGGLVGRLLTPRGASLSHPSPAPTVRVHAQANARRPCPHVAGHPHHDPPHALMIHTMAPHVATMSCRWEKRC